MLKFKQKNFYYVDKTGMIAELLKGRGKVNLFTRPRRFGKSLNMSMLKYFFELGTDTTLFDGLSISEEPGLCEEQLTYDTIYENVENMWSLLYATGYLTQSETPSGDLVRLVIPNTEVRFIFSNFILKMFEKDVAEDGAAVTEFCRALKVGDASDVQNMFTKFMSKTISIRDTAVKKEFKENFYHGMLRENRESGDGYYDILIEIEDEKIGIVIEVKYAENESYDEQCAEALKQINENNYIAELLEDDMQTILKYGIACYKKQCRVVLERER